MKKYRLGLCLFAAALLLLGSCDNHPGSERQLKEVTDSFATAYYNWDFPTAAKYATPDSRKWLQYAAAQVHKEDIEALKTMEMATFELGDIVYHKDSTAEIKVTVNNYLGMDTIGSLSHIVEKGIFTLSLKYSNEEWKIRMANLPRSERQSRD